MADDKEALIEKVVLLAATAGAAWVAQKALGAVWKRTTGRTAPINPLDNDSTIPGVVAFAAVTGAVAALAKIAADRGARRITKRIAAGRASA